MLQCHSHYSFLEGVSAPEVLAERAAELGLPFASLTDRDGLFGASLFYQACKRVGIHGVIGAVVEGALLLCENMVGYSNLSQMITRGVLEGAEGLFCVADERLEEMMELFGADRVFVGLSHFCEEGDRERCWKLWERARERGLGCVVAGGVRYARKEEGRLFDVLTCIRHHKRLDESEEVRAGNWERYLRDPRELYGEFPGVVEATEKLAGRCQVDLDFSSYRFPEFPVPVGETSASYLRKVCLERSEWSPELEEELALIEKLGMSGYFLIVWDIVEFAKKQGIPAQGRGSAANSLVAFVLGITPVDPRKHDLFLGRFIHEEMTAIPDIDLDFAATRDPDLPDREDVIQYVYEKYGAEHVAMVCTFITFRHKLAAREVGKVLGLDKRLIEQVAKHGFLGEEPTIYRELVEGLKGIPRHMSIHVGGMLIASRPISDLVPLQQAAMKGRVVCQWDKDMVEDAGLIKVDILSLGMLAVLRDVGEEIEEDDPEVYDVICRADTVGLFQIESRAQMQSLPKTEPRDLPQLGIQVAIIRPGPLQGRMVNPYIRRRQGLEPVAYAHPCLEPVLGETLGVILFQEQVLKVAVAMGGFSPGEADGLRRAMSRKRSGAAMEELRARFLAGAAEKGVAREVAEGVFEQLLGFASYGFCKSHALSFAHIAYRSAYLKLHHPAKYLAAMLNNQPMGFYSPAVLIGDGKRHGVEILPVDINQSEARTVALGGAIRLGLMLVQGVGLEGAKQLVAGRPYSDLRDCAARSGLPEEKIEALVQAGAFGGKKRDDYWKLWSREHAVPLVEEVKVPELPLQTAWEELLDDYRALGFSAEGHPIPFFRNGQLRSDELGGVADGQEVRVAGVQVIRQRPPTAKGFVFLTLEDEAGLMNIIVAPKVWEAYKILLKEVNLLEVVGIKEGGNVKARALLPLNISANR